MKEETSYLSIAATIFVIFYLKVKIMKDKSAINTILTFFDGKPIHFISILVLDTEYSRISIIRQVNSIYARLMSNQNILYRFCDENNVRIRK